MRLVWAVIPLILIVSMIGIVGIQSVDARCLDPAEYCFLNLIRITDLEGNSIDTVHVDKQYSVITLYPMEVDFLCYYAINVPISLCPDQEFPMVVGDELIEHPPDLDYVFIIQIKDEQGIVVDLQWINGTATDIPTDLKMNLIPKKSGTYTLESFIWTSFENPMIATTPTVALVVVEP